MRKEVNKIARCGCNPVCSCLIQVTDGACLDLSITGLGTPTNPYVITGEVKVDGDTVVCGPSGLQSSINTQDTNTVDLSGDGSAATPLTADVILTPNGTLDPSGPNVGSPIQNLVRKVPGPGGGIFVSCEDVQDCIGAEIGPAIAGTCLTYDDTTNKVNVAVSPEPNGVDCTPTGLAVIPSTDPNNQLVFGTDNSLFVPASPTVVNVIDNAENISAVVGPADTITFDCVAVPVTTDTQIPGAGGGCLTVTGDTCNGLALHLNISGETCNGIECRPDGLYMPQPISINDLQDGFRGAGLPLVAGVGTFTFGDFCVTVTNTSCCRVTGLFSQSTGNINFVANPGTTFGFDLQESLNGGPFNPAFPSTGGVFSNPGPGNQSFPLSTLDTFLGTLGPGEVVQLCLRLVVTVFAGGGTFTPISPADPRVSFEIAYNLNPTPANCP